MFFAQNGGHPHSLAPVSLPYPQPGGDIGPMGWIRALKLHPHHFLRRSQYPDPGDLVMSPFQKGRKPGRRLQHLSMPILWILGTPLPILSCLFVGACSDSVTRVEGSLGGIEVTTVTESPSVLPDSFTVLLNGSAAGRIGRDDTYVIPFLPPGNYLVELVDEWKGCWLGCNVRPVTVESKENVPTTFLIRCKGEPEVPPSAG